MSIENIPYILQRKCEDRSGVRITKKYLCSFWNQSSCPPPDSENAYNQLMQDFLYKDIDLTSEPVIPIDFGQKELDTFPPGHLRHGGGVVLQIQDTIDIRNSVLSQLNFLTNAAPVRQVYKERSEEDEVTIPRGLLRWTLTDGKNQIQAMEQETIPDLSLLTSFGCKILVKSCQIRRGMLILTRDSVKVLGGEVPELFGGNMLKEIISRLNEKLGTETPQPLQSSSQRIEPPVSTDLTEDDFFDDDDFDYTQLENMKTDNHVDHEDTLMDEIPSDSSLFDEDLNYVTNPQQDMLKKTPSDVFVDAADTIQKKTSIQPAAPSSKKPKIASLSKKTRLISPSTDTQPAKQMFLGRQADPDTSMSLPEDTVDLTGDDLELSTQAELEDVSWIDSSVWDDLTEAVKEKEGLDDGTFVDDQGKTHITFIKLQQILKDMEDDKYRSSLPDTVIVRVKCVQFGKLVTSNRLYSLVLYFDDPDQTTNNPVQVVFSNDILTTLLNARRQDVVNVNAAGGQKAVLRQIFKPFDKKDKRKRPRITLELLELSSTADFTTASEHALAEKKKNQELINSLKKDNILLKSQFEALQSCHGVEAHSKDATIKDLIAKKAEAEARAVYHMRANNETKKELAEAKLEIQDLTNEWEMKSKHICSELEYTKEQLIMKERESKRLIDEKEMIEKEKEAEVRNLTAKIQILNNSLNEKTKTYEKLKETIKELENTPSRIDQPNDYEKLERQFINVCEKNKVLLSENKDASRKLRQYVDMEQEMKQYGDETMSIQEIFSKMTQVHEENKQLIFEISQLKGERESWEFYLNTQNQSPLAAIRELTKKAHEADGVIIENKRLGERLIDTINLIRELETHIIDLKKAAVENKMKYGQALAAKECLFIREKTFKLRIDLLKEQLDLYEQEEKAYMAETYDEKKSMRIVELENLLNQYQDIINKQSVEISDLRLNNLPQINISHGPYEEISSGMTIVDYLTKMFESENEFVKKMAENYKLRNEEHDETKAVKNDTNDTNDGFDGVILHLIDNPDSTKRAARADTIKKLREENEQLLKDKLMSADDSSIVSLPLVGITNLKKRIEELIVEVGKKEKHIDRLHTCWKAQIDKQRDTIQAVLGYKVTTQRQGQIARLESIFVDDSKLVFYVKMADEENEAKLRIGGSMKDFYMKSLLDDVYVRCIARDKNIPAFLNAAGHELYIQHREEVNHEIEKQDDILLE